MAKPFSAFDIAGRAMSAQLVRLNTTASNLANAGSVSGSAATAFRAIKPVFKTVTDGPSRATVGIDRVVTSDVQPTRRHAPDHPLADRDGNIWEAGVDSAAELVDMIESARQYQNNVQVLQTAKTLTLDTLRLGQ
jgi:flagellar basal-body rod protein FlgC